MGDECEHKIKGLLVELNRVFNLIEEGCKDASAANKFALLNELRRIFDEYSNFLSGHFEEIPEYKRPLYSRQKSTVESKCKTAVESLDFAYETDFLYALSLDDSVVNESVYASPSSALPLNRTISDPELNASPKGVTRRTLSLKSLTDLSPEATFIQEGSVSQCKMATFDLRLANTICPDFDGDPKNVIDFLDKAEFYNDTLEEESKALFLDFLLKVKLLSKVKTKFCTGVPPTNFAGFKQEIIARFSSKTTRQEKTDQIERLHQKSTVANFATTLETLCAELIGLKMQNQDEAARPFVRREVDELAVRVFTRGLKRTEVRQALIYKEPDSLQSAIAFALEADAKLGPMNESFNVNTFTNRRQRGNFTNRSNGRGGRGQPNGGQRSNNNPNYRGNQFQPQANRGRFSQGRGRGFDRNFNDQRNRSAFGQGDDRTFRDGQGNSQSGNFRSNNYRSNDYRPNNFQSGNFQSNRGGTVSRTFNNSNYSDQRRNRNRYGNDRRSVNVVQESGNEQNPQRVDRVETRLRDSQM